MKRIVLLAIASVLLVLGGGIIQALVGQVQRSKEASNQRREIEADLEKVYESIVAYSKKNEGTLPSRLSDIDWPDSIASTANDYVYEPTAGQTEALVEYRGNKKSAQGYCVWKNGMVTNGRVRIGEVRIQELPEKDDI